MGAASIGILETVKLLLDKGADVNARNNEGQSALSLALESAYPGSDRNDIVELLRQHGAKE